MLQKGLIALGEIPIYGFLASKHRLIVAVVEYSPRHPTKNRLNHIQELSPRWQRHEINKRRFMTKSKSVAIDFINSLIESLGNVPRCRIPRDKQAILIFVDYGQTP